MEIGQAPSSYYESNFLSRRWRRGLAKMLKELLPVGWESARLLDVGVGDGYTIRLVKPEGPVFGIDIDPSMEELATAKGVDFRSGSAYRIPFPDATFDVVTCVEVVEHLERPGEALEELKRVLKLGGSVVLTTPVPKVSWRIIWWGWTRFGPGKRWESSPHVTELSLSGNGGQHNLSQMLKELGFEIEKTASCNFGLISGARATRTK
ncbi:MAG TPA: methyltransferase domain-containing protein [Nitrososphaerales archaeon]|nr:methyltransferase domain-containing protein [Nitrososphaerales archaeon]